MVGPFETDSVTVEPGVTTAFAPGSWATTTPFGWSESTSVRLTAKFWPWSSPAACSYGSPTTPGTWTGFTPRDTFTCTTVFSGTFVPAFGSCAVTVPGSSVE